MYILSTFYFQKKMRVAGGRGRKQISTNKTCYQIKKISTSLLSVEGVGRARGEAIFTQKNLNLKC